MNAQTLVHDLTARGVRLWAEAGNLKLDAPVGLLTDEDILAIRQHKADLLAALTPQPGTCPTCQGAADLQDQQLDTWWCASCRLFFDSKGQAIPPATSPRPLTLEQQEAEKLAADLVAAGCGFNDDGEFFGVRVPFKISAALLARLETADRQELRRAAAKLAEVETAKGWVN
jgi:hypothetical protein